MEFQERTIDEVIDSEEWSRHELVLFMRGQGWEDDPAGGVRHGNDHDKRFPTYFEAAKACIGIASEF